ncbi:vitamin B12 ABC transporter substrate-binding protein BtuF [uncultured Vibrio sp.]|uniref:vitamin B12 ABC transporter substrate-binding protein BtuF n=1 Tax=uncultured Vibrio sp. TaxID=114054 RepID=UPI00091DD44F|nr:vitamin B12 ABC transporter substrate-binding protein BtuF [uncultured Vibrio sp.]OIQ23110.1 MAG: cobalamin-binding protein [Vibrio sp. MedPE-SWchi]
MPRSFNIPIIIALSVSFSSMVQASTHTLVERVVSLAPHATEIAFAAGLGDKLIAVSAMSDYPPQVEEIEKVANYQGIKLERIIALQPDLIIAWPSGNPQKELDMLESFGFNIYYSDTKTLDDIADNIEQLSLYSDDPAFGHSQAKQYREQLTSLSEKYQVEQPVRYFYQLSEKPIITVAQGHWPSEVFSFCGGVNIFENSPTAYPQVGIEQVVVAQPEVMFYSDHAMADGGMWQAWEEQLPAVKNKAVWSLQPDWLNRPTPRTLLAIEQVCEHLESVREKR